MQDDMKMCGKEESKLDLNVTATCRISRGYKLPLAKLTVSGTINESTADSDANKIVQRAIIFVIDRSYSMFGERMTMVKSALRPFVEEIVTDDNTIIKLVLFNNSVEIVNIPKDRNDAGSTIEKKVYASGGTDFEAASKGLVIEAQKILEQNPSYQLTVIMCSDGQVGKDNAERGHKHWKTFVNETYLKIHKIPPYVETIGISSGHDADVLDGFIIDDNAGNYCQCLTPALIRQAFENAQNETMGRTSTKLSVEFPLNVYNDIYNSKNEQNKFHLHDLIVTSDEFKEVFWVSIDDYDNTTTGGDGMNLLINGEIVPIEITEVKDDEQCQYEAIDFYNAVLKDMLHTLRNITDAEQLKSKAKEIENELNNDYIKTFELITAEPVEKQKLQNEIKRLLDICNNNDTDADEKNDDNTFDGDMDKLIKRRAELMKRYKQMNRLWKKHRQIVSGFQNTLAGVKQLVREIILGQVRLQEIRQHILDLHFRKKHAKRIQKLVLTDEQLAKRKELYDKVELPEEKDCQSITDEVGTGCYLSTLSKRECVLDGDPLWICGRVKRTGGAAVSNPELLDIEYISSDLVSDSYFRMALEAAGGDIDDERKKVKVGFADSSREKINARLFPIYGNIQHYRCSKVYIHEVLSHTLSARVDIRVVDYNSLAKTMGYMISMNDLTYKNVKRILYEMIPSYQLFLDNTKAKPYKSDGRYIREPDPESSKVKLAEKNRMRVVKYVETFKARTSAWVSNVTTLFADRLMNLDVDFDQEFYLSIIIQRLRRIFGSQIPKKLDEDELRNKVVKNHKNVLQVLICGVENKDNDEDMDKTQLLPFASIKDKPSKKKYYEMFDVPKIAPIELDKDDEKILKEWNVDKISASTKDMLIQILSRLDIRDLIQGNMFFNVLSNMKCDVDKDKYQFDEFRNNKFAIYEKIPNDLNILLEEIGFKYNINVLRAICCVSIICHSNRLWQDNLEWFGDDKLKQIFNDPESVLTTIYKNYVIKNIRHEYDVYLENKRIGELIEIHSDPILPDDIDKYGNLPELRCGWTRCGKLFDNRDKLLDHVRRCIPHPFLHRFHVNCRNVLEPNPNLPFKKFSDKVLALFDESRRKLISERELKAYYQQFQPLFRKGVAQGGGIKHEPTIVSSSNMYYFDQLVTVRKG